jgi:hypothetical protein
MKDCLDEAGEELKRVDHQIYVSLKYTRTVDVLLNIISRMIDAYDHMLEGLLRLAKEKKIISDIPASPIKRAEILKIIYNDTKIHENIDLYFLLRKILKTAPQRENEYRRHVTLITVLDGKEEIINIDIITKYYHFQKEFLHYLEQMQKAQV